MPDSNLPIANKEATAPEQPANLEEILGMSAPTPPDAPAPTDTEPVQPAASLEADIEEELIIEDFTIDGICGVY